MFSMKIQGTYLIQDNLGHSFPYDIILFFTNISNYFKKKKEKR